MMDMHEKIAMLPSLRAVVDAYGLAAKKSLGQNFLLDAHIPEKIVRLSLSAQNLENLCGQDALEIGPGPGGLTRAVLNNQPRKLTVIEMDERCLRIMQDIQEKTGACLDIVNGDALTYDYSGIEKGCHVFSNLPYNISVPLLTLWLTDIERFSSLTLMFQKEVADRILASPGSKTYGRLSVLAQLQCQIVRLTDLNPSCFVPAPKVWSSVLLFQPRSGFLQKQEISAVEKVTAMAFGNRRKMIRQSMKNFPGLEEKCASLGIALTSRAEEISPEQYLALVRQSA